MSSTSFCDNFTVSLSLHSLVLVKALWIPQHLQVTLADPWVPHRRQTTEYFSGCSTTSACQTPSQSSTLPSTKSTNSSKARVVKNNIHPRLLLPVLLSPDSTPQTPQPNHSPKPSPHSPFWHGSPATSEYPHTSNSSIDSNPWHSPTRQISAISMNNTFSASSSCLISLLTTPRLLQLIPIILNDLPTFS